MPEISVIVPIYNVAPFLDKCVKSLFNQTITENIEYIFIDDASTDNSLELLQNLITHYPHLSSHIKIIEHPTNKGILFTRNEGISVANGEYIIQIDSDDWVEPNMLEKMLLKGKETDADIIGCDLYEEYSESSKYISIPFGLPHDKSIEELITGVNLKSYLPIRMIKRTHYLRYGMNTPEGISLYEDRCICLPLHYFSNKTVHIPIALYHYRQTSGSLTKKITIESFNSAWRSIQFMMDFLHKIDMYNLYRKQIERAKAEVAIWLIFRTDIFYPEIWKKIRPSIDIFYLPIYKKISAVLIDRGFYTLNKIYVKTLRKIRRIAYKK